jgi:hypothetical protein
MNKTFAGDNFNYNACVGNNGHVDLITYSDGYDAVVKLALEKIDNLTIPQDILVYPLVYSARHRIELFLKYQLLKIGHIKSKIFPTTNTKEIIRTHEISILWDMFKRRAEFEPRLQEIINEIDEYVNDFAQIDDTGEVFRYPSAADGKKHLTHISVVNLLSFKERYLELTSKFESLEYLTIFLIEEYDQGTVAGGLSRDAIKNIANQLPSIETWKENENFTQIKNKIKTEYGLSSNSLSKIINLIKGNFEFSQIIGRDLEITEITTTELIYFIEIFNQFIIERQKKDSNSMIEDKVAQIKEKLSANAIYALSQLYDVGFFKLYPEEYARGLHIIKGKNLDVLIRFSLLRNGIVVEKIIDGLKICRQTKLLESIGQISATNTQQSIMAVE